MRIQKLRQRVLKATRTKPERILPSQGSSWACGKASCRHSVPFTEYDSDLWLARVPLRKQLHILCLWLEFKQPSGRLLAEVCHLEEDTLLELLGKFRWWIVKEMHLANRFMQIGGENCDVELDEIAFRATSVSVDGQTKVAWFPAIL